MSIQIRRGIFETSSSSASSLVVVSGNTKKETKYLDKPFDIVQGAYSVSYDSAPHIYLTDWRSKLSFFLEYGIDKSLLQRIVKKHTGQKFLLWKLWAEASWLTCKHQEKAFLQARGRVPEKKEMGGYTHYYIDGYLCAWICDGWKNVIALPGCMNGRRYGLTKISTSNSYWALLQKEKEGVVEAPEFYEECIFNDSIGINIGGNDHWFDFRRGIPGRTVLPKESESPYQNAQEALQMRNYVPLVDMVHNGNEILWIGCDGTKMRICKGEKSEPEYPDIIDLKITDCCEHHCAFCYENSSPKGLHGRIDYPFLSTIPSFVEIAVGGGNPLVFPELDKVAELTDIVNITIHEDDWVNTFLKGHFNMRQQLDKFHGVGVSLTGRRSFGEILELTRFNPDEYCAYGKNLDYGDGDTIFHVINGVLDSEEFESMYNLGIKLLILGFKDKGRGSQYNLENKEKLRENQNWLYENLEELVKHFSVVSFDALALEQLDVKRLVSDEDWEKYYMGEDGTHSMYIDLVKGEFGISSTDDRRWPVTDDIRDMFQVVRRERSICSRKGDWDRETSPALERRRM